MKPRKRVLKNGASVWDARWIGMDGKEKSHACKTQRDAKRYAAKREEEVEHGVAVEGASTRQTVRTLATAWASQTSNDGTKDFREQLLKNLGPLADVPINKVKPALIRHWHTELQAGRSWIKDCTGLSDNYRINLLAQLNAMFNQAVEDELLARNPATSVRPGTRPDASVSPNDLPTADEVNAIIRTKREGGPRKYYEVDGHKTYRRVQASPVMGAVFRVLAATGMRVSECAGLEWSKVDFDAGAIRVDVQAHRYAGTLIPLKTKAKGKRTVSVDAGTMRELRGLKNMGLHESRVFVNSRGTPVDARDIYQAFKTTVAYLELDPVLTPKSFRHFHASVLISKGASVKVVQHRLGHATASRTLNTYSHLLPSDDSDAAVLFAESVFSRYPAPNMRVIDGDLAG